MMVLLAFVGEEWAGARFCAQGSLLPCCRQATAQQVVLQPTDLRTLFFDVRAAVEQKWWVPSLEKVAVQEAAVTQSGASLLVPVAIIGPHEEAVSMARCAMSLSPGTQFDNGGRWNFHACCRDA